MAEFGEKGVGFCDPLPLGRGISVFMICLRGRMKVRDRGRRSERNFASEGITPVSFSQPLLVLKHTCDIKLVECNDRMRE
jgi:hypothetical protein